MIIMYGSRRISLTMYHFKIEKHAFIAFCWMFLCGSLILAQQPIDSTQWKIHRQEMKRLAAEQSRKFKASLSPTEKKYQTVVKLVRKMKADMADSIHRYTNISERYSNYGTEVDDTGRIQTILLLSRKAKMADTLIIVQGINKSGGHIDAIYRPPFGQHEIEIYCWLPYDAFDKIFQLPNVTGTTFPPVIAPHR
jgi:hypothetical protein